MSAALADEDMRTVLQGAAPLFHPSLTPEGMRGGRGAGGRGSASRRRSGGSVRSNSTSGSSATTSSSNSSSSSSSALPVTSSSTADAASPVPAAAAADAAGAGVAGEVCEAVIGSARPGNVEDTLTASESSTDGGSAVGSQSDAVVT